MKAITDAMESTRLAVGRRVGASAIADGERPECEACRQGQSTWYPALRFRSTKGPGGLIRFLAIPAA